MSNMSNMSKEANKDATGCRIVDVETGELHIPTFRAVESLDETLAQTRRKVHELIEDLQCLQLAYVFKSNHLDRDLIHQRLQTMSYEFSSLEFNQTLFPSSEDYANFISTARSLIRGTIMIIKASRDRDTIRLSVQKELFDETVREAHPKYEPSRRPWTKFLASNAPGLRYAHFLAPYELPAPIDPKFPQFRTVKSSSIQALPQATSAILAKWTWDFKQAIDYYHELHPEDPDFKGPIQRKLIAKNQAQLTPNGLQTEAVRSHDFGNHPYAQAMEWVTADGEEKRGSLGRFLGRLERRDVPTPAAANRVYVVRRWILQ